MTRHIVWKEAREQGAVLLALVGLGAGLMAATAVLNTSTAAAQGLSYRSVNAAGPILLVMLVMTAGVVVGGSLFAGEREAGTFTYLDHLPASRWRVWWRKVLAGALLTAVAAGLLLVAAGLAGQLGGNTRPILIGWSLAVAVLAAVGFGWGVFGSTRAESSLAACGIGLAAAGATTTIGAVVMAVLWNVTHDWVAPYLRVGRMDDGSMIGLLTAWTVLFVPLPLAAVLFTRPDRSRRLAEQDIRPERGAFSPAALVPKLPRISLFEASKRMRWLLWRQLRATLAVQAALGVGFGMLLVPWNEDWWSSLIWPGAGFLLGVLVGVASFGDEQRSGAARFWAERRLPIGRLWRNKVLFGGALLSVVCGLALFPSVVGMMFGLTNARPGGPVDTADQMLAHYMARTFHSGIFEPGFPHLTYLVVGPVYGFAFGHLAGMLFQKGIVAGAVGLLVGGTFGAAWVPSLLGGGVHGWMILLPPVVALLTARWMAWPWATDQLGRRRALLRLAGGFVAATGCVAAGVTYRAIGEVEEVANADEHIRFRAALPTFDENQPGRDIRRALSKWQELPTDVRDAETNLLLSGRPEVDRTASGADNHRLRSQMAEVLRDGWPAGRPDADRWIDAAFDRNWDEPVFAVVGKPVGVLEDPNEYQGLYQPLKYIQPFQELTPVFLARGLQKQAKGDPADFVRRLEAWLACCRTAKRHTLPTVAMIAEHCEGQVFRALDRWLERLDGRPDLVKRAMEVVQRHDALDKPAVADVRLAEQVIIQNAADNPGYWLPRWLENSVQPAGGLQPGNRAGGRAETEANLTGFAWTVPWERERLRRAVALGNDPTRRPERAELLAGAPGIGTFAALEARYDTRSPYSTKTVATRRAAIVSLALRLHRLDAGRYPDSLEELVPARLAAVPLDPDASGPIRYRRVAKAEVLLLPTNLTRSPRTALPPGLGLSYPEYLSVAGAVGGLTGWPFQPGWLNTEAEGSEDELILRTPGMAAGLPPGGMGAGGVFASELPLADEWLRQTGDEARMSDVKLTAGRAVLWTVGENKRDESGYVMDDRDTRSGDFVFVVPDPPTSSRKPASAP